MQILEDAVPIRAGKLVHGVNRRTRIAGARQSPCLQERRRQIELANPNILVCLGGPAMQTLLGIKDGITRSRGRWFPFDTGTREIRALATFHPAFLLRSPLQKRFAWRDFLALKKALAA